MVENLTDNEIYANLKTVLEKVAFKTTSLDAIGAETRLLEDLEIDSVRLVDLVLELEDEYKISIEDGAIESIRTVGDLLVLIKEKSNR